MCTSQGLAAINTNEAMPDGLNRPSEEPGCGESYPAPVFLAQQFKLIKINDLNMKTCPFTHSYPQKMFTAKYSTYVTPKRRMNEASIPLQAVEIVENAGLIKY